MNTDNANKYLNERQIYQRDVWDSKDIEHPLDCLLEDYHQEQLKLLGIGVVIERFSTGQPVKWEGMKFWVAEDNGDSKVLVCNCEDTKDIQQSEYNDWWVDRDVLNAI